MHQKARTNLYSHLLILVMMIGEHSNNIIHTALVVIKEWWRLAWDLLQELL